MNYITVKRNWFGLATEDITCKNCCLDETESSKISLNDFQSMHI